MKQYVYCVVELNLVWDNPLLLRYKTTISGQGGFSTPDINTLGNDGWELITIMNTVGPSASSSQQEQKLLGVFKKESEGSK